MLDEIDTHKQHSWVSGPFLTKSSFVSKSTMKTLLTAACVSGHSLTRAADFFISRADAFCNSRLHPVFSSHTLCVESILWRRLLSHLRALGKLDDGPHFDSPEAGLRVFGVSLVSFFPCPLTVYKVRTQLCVWRVFI